MLQSVKDIRQGSGHQVGGVFAKLGRVVAMRPFANGASGNTHHHGTGGYVGDYHGIGTNTCSFVHRDGAEHLGAGANNHAIFNIGVALHATLDAGAPEGDALIDRDVIAHGAGLADDDAGGVVDKDALTDNGGGVNVHARDPSTDVGHHAREGDAAVAVKKVREAMCD